MVYVIRADEVLHFLPFSSNIFVFIFSHINVHWFRKVVLACGLEDAKFYDIFERNPCRVRIFLERVENCSVSWEIHTLCGPGTFAWKLDVSAFSCLEVQNVGNNAWREFDCSKRKTQMGNFKNNSHLTEKCQFFQLKRKVYCSCITNSRCSLKVWNF